MDNVVFTGIHAMFGMIGETAGVFVLSDAVRLCVLDLCLSSLDKIPLVDHGSVKTGSIEPLN